MLSLSFIPVWFQVGRILHAIKMGWMQPRKPKALEDDEPKYYNLWEAEDNVRRVVEFSLVGYCN